LKFAILGGSFNPIHSGHLFLADLVLQTLSYDRIILIPAFQSPFKLDAEAPSPQDRLDMIAASLPGESRITFDPCEVRREGISFTIDTLGDIQSRYRPEGKPGLIIGDDLAPEFHRWRRAEDIAAQADIIIARRTGSPLPDFPFPCTILDNEEINISSRMVRDKIRRGENWRSLVPPGAGAIIEDRGLYGLVPRSPSLALIRRVEAQAQAGLSPKRFLHSRNTALLSRDLCLRFGLEPRRGYLAGIAHDLCKSMKPAEQLSLAKRDREKVSRLERKTPSLLHGRAAAVLLRDWYQVEDEEIIDAVRRHTLCSPDMGPLAKIVYAADKIEISRENVKEELRVLSREADLDTLFTAVFRDTLGWLSSREMKRSPGAAGLMDAMEKKRK
jgi:nicotinate-nucleotide adenylyltransferase